MPLSIHLIAAAIVLVSWVGLVAALVRTAPVAHQDHSGFRLGETDGVDVD